MAPVPDAERLIKATIRLTSGNVKLVRRALISDYMDVRLVPYLIPLLGNDAVAEDIRMELRWMAPRIIGQLTDALLDPDMPLLVRQRLPGVLEVSHNPRIIHSLLQGLADEEFNVRYSCTRALARMRARDADLRISDETVFAAVQREVNVDLEVWRGRDLMVDMDLSTENVMDTSSIHRADRSLEHVFNLLSLILDQEAVKSGFRALVSTDQNLRGTALEYLENVLPERLKAALWNQLGVDAAPKKPRSRVPSGAPKAEAAQKK